MKDAKLVGTLLEGHCKLGFKQCPSNEKENGEMKCVPYSSTIGSLMYVVVYTTPYITHTIGVVSRFLGNPGKKYWATVK